MRKLFVVQQHEVLDVDPAIGEAVGVEEGRRRIHLTECFKVIVELDCPKGAVFRSMPPSEARG